MKKLFLIALHGFISIATFGQTTPATYEPATITLKNGTVRDVVMEVTKPIDMQTEIRCFDPKLLTAGRTASTVQMEKFIPGDLKEIRTKRKFYETKKYANLSGPASFSTFGKFYILEAVKHGKISLYHYYRPNETEPELLIGKQGDDKLKPVAATGLMKYIEDAAPIMEKFKSGGYGNNPKKDNAILNDNLVFINQLVDEYNEFSAFNRLLTAEDKDAIRKRNEILIFDLFMNYELSQRNGNNAVVIDYLPNRGKKDLKRVVMKSNYGHEDETTEFKYSGSGDLSLINYQRSGKLFVYDFTYVNGRPVNVFVGGKKRIEFLYSYDTLKTIVREQNGMFVEYDLVYVPGQQKVDIKLAVVNKGKRQQSSSKYYVAWNNENKVTEFSIDVYSSKGISYSPTGDIASFSTRDSEGRERIANWEYTTDEKNNWTERKLDKYLVTRQIEYAAR